MCEQRCLLQIVLSVLLLPGFCAPILAQSTDAYGDELPAGAVQRLGSLRLKYGGINDLAYLPDGRLVVLIGNTLDIWDMSTGTRQEHRKLPVSAVSLNLNQDATQLLFATTDTKVCLYDLHADKELKSWPSGQQGLKSAQFSPDGKRVLTVGHMPPTLKEWDLNTGQELVNISGKLVYFDAGVYALDGKVAVAGGGYSSVEFWDLGTGSLLKTVPSDYCVYTMVTSADGKRVLAGERTRGSEWDVATEKPLGLFTGHLGGAVTSQCYGLDPDEVYTGSRDGSVRRWNRLKPTLLGRWYPHSSSVTHVRVSPDGRWVASYGTGQYIVECSRENGKPRLQWERHQAPVETVTWTSDNRIISGSLDGTARIWEPESGKCLTVLPAGLGASCVAGSFDGSRVAVGSKDSLIREYTMDGKPLRELKGHCGYIRALAYLPDGRLASCADDGTILLWGEKIEPLLKLEGHRGGVLALAVLDGQHVASAGRDGTVRMWDPASGKQLWNKTEHRGYVTCLSVGAQGNLLSSGRDGRILCWDKQGTLLPGEANTGSWVNAIAATADGTAVYSGTDKLTAWRLADGKQTVTREGHVGPINALAVAPDGKRFVSASADGTLLIWSL